MTLLQLYILTRLDHLGQALALLGTCLLISSIISMVAWVILHADEFEDDEDRLSSVGNFAKSSAIWLCVVTFLNVAVPTKEDIYVMLGGYYATNNEEIKKLPSNVIGAANTFLEEFSHKPAAKSSK